MKHKITSVSELGAIMRAARKSSGVRIDDLALLSRLSKQFVNDVELGKEGVQLGKVLKVLSELGVHVYVDVPSQADELLTHSREQIGRTKSRRVAQPSETPLRDQDRVSTSNAMSMSMFKVSAKGGPIPVPQEMLEAVERLRVTAKGTKS
jgi:transcriptional regulator with XRE-family HTH domain